MNLTLLMAGIVSLAGGQGPSYQAVGLDGHVAKLPISSATATLLIFINHDCPICNRYAPEIGRIARAFKPRGLSSFVVYAESGVAPGEERRHAAAYHLPTALRDSQYALTRKLNMHVTPEAIVLGRHGEALYKGRIDDLYVQVGISKPSARRHDLREAIEQVLAGRPVTTPRTEPIGCWISRD